MHAFKRPQVQHNLAEINWIRAVCREILAANGEEDGHKSIEIERLSFKRRRMLIILELLESLSSEGARFTAGRFAQIEQLSIVFGRIMSGYIGTDKHELHHTR